MADFRSISLADRVFEKLESDIVQGVYPRGEIVTELKLAEQLGVSRTPIREALRRLEQEHLIEDAGKGSLILGISEENLIDIMDIRIHIEPMASYYAAMNINEEAAKELTHIMDLQEFYFSKHDVEHLRQEDEDFHDALCRHCKRSVISDTLVPIHRKTRRYRKISIENYDRQARSIEEHWAICRAVITGDADMAASLTAEHVKKAKANMIERIKANG